MQAVSCLCFVFFLFFESCVWHPHINISPHPHRHHWLSYPFHCKLGRRSFSMREIHLVTLVCILNHKVVLWWERKRSTCVQVVQNQRVQERFQTYHQTAATLLYSPVWHERSFLCRWHKAVHAAPQSRGTVLCFFWVFVESNKSCQSIFCFN